MELRSMPIEPLPQPPKNDWFGLCLILVFILFFVGLVVRGAISVACGL
jgi:hypothetical protein